MYLRVFSARTIESDGADVGFGLEDMYGLACIPRRKIILEVGTGEIAVPEFDCVFDTRFVHYLELTFSFYVLTSFRISIH